MSKDTNRDEPTNADEHPPQSPIDLGFAEPVVRSFDASDLSLAWNHEETGEVGRDEHGNYIISFVDSRNLLHVRIPGEDHATEFRLKQLHFHAPSEHRVFAAHWPFELHFVHTAQVEDKQRKCLNTIYAALTVMIEKQDKIGFVEDGADKILRRFEEKFRSSEKANGGKSNSGADDTPLTFDPIELLPPGLRDAPLHEVPFWRYEGSLTSKIDEPNSGFVSWIVINRVKYVRPDRLDYWTGGESNLHKSKPVQDLKGRVVERNLEVRTSADDTSNAEKA